MKILIVATPRSGSTQLANALGEILNLRVFREPFASFYVGEPYDYTLPHVVKVLVDEYTDTKLDPTIYDKTFFLSRKDVKKASESFDYQLKYNLNKPLKWHEKYFLPDNQFVDQYTFTKLHTMTESIQILSNKVVWYEDLYSGEIDKVKEILYSWGLAPYVEELLTYLNPAKKYRYYKKLNLL